MEELPTLHLVLFPAMGFPKTVLNFFGESLIVLFPPNEVQVT